MGTFEDIKIPCDRNGEVQDGWGGFEKQILMYPLPTLELEMIDLM